MSKSLHEAIQEVASNVQTHRGTDIPVKYDPKRGGTKADRERLKKKVRQGAEIARLTKDNLNEPPPGRVADSVEHEEEVIAELKMPKTNKYGEVENPKIKQAFKAGERRAKEQSTEHPDVGTRLAAAGRREKRSNKVTNVRARLDAFSKKSQDKVGAGPRKRTSLVSKARGLLGRGLSAAGKALGDSVQHNAPVINEREDPHVAADPRHPANRGGGGGSGRPTTYHVNVDGVKHHSQLPYMSMDGKMHGPGKKAGKLPKGAKFRTPVGGDK